MTAAPAFLLPVTEIWISREEFLRRADRSRQWLFLEERSGRVVSRETTAPMPNGRNAREYALSSLPQAARERYAAEQAALTPATQHELPLLFGKPQLVIRAPRVKVSASKMSEAQQRQQILEPILAMQNPHAKHTYSQLALADGRAVTSQNRMCEYQIEQAAQRGVTLNMRTLKRWIAAHKENGTAGLARRTRKDAGRSRYFDQPENQDAAALVAHLHLGDGLTPGLSVQACYDMLVQQREIVGLAKADLPHYDTVRVFLADQLSNSLRVYARRGSKEFGERMLPYISRAYNEPANWAWVSDTAIMDVEVLNDCIDGAPKGAPVRLRLTAIIDFRSRYVVGYSWAWEGSSASIASALRSAVSQHGPCELIYFDNGKDFCKVAKGAVPGYVQPNDIDGWAEREMRSIENTGVLSRLGIQVTHCLPHHPQSKHIERFFRTMHLTFCKLWSTYTGGKPSERPDQTAALMTIHRRAMRSGDLTRSHHPLASEFMSAFAQWLPVYHAHSHRGRGMDGNSPEEVFRKHRNPKQRPTPSADELVHLLWEHTTAKVSECQIRVNKHDYAATGIREAKLLLDLNERRVSVAYDPLDPAQVAVLDDAGHLLAVLQPKRLARMAPDDPATQAQIAEMQQQRGLLKRTLKEQHSAIIRKGKQLEVRTPLQLMSTSTPVDLASRITPRKPSSSLQPETRAPRYAHELAADILRRRGNK